jgi:hypothetical protein
VGQGGAASLPFTLPTDLSQEVDDFCIYQGRSALACLSFAQERVFLAPMRLAPASATPWDTEAFPWASPVQDGSCSPMRLRMWRSDCFQLCGECLVPSGLPLSVG